MWGHSSTWWIRGICYRSQSSTRLSLLNTSDRQSNPSCPLLHSTLDSSLLDDHSCPSLLISAYTDCSSCALTTIAFYQSLTSNPQWTAYRVVCRACYPDETSVDGVRFTVRLLYSYIHIISIVTSARFRTGSRYGRNAWNAWRGSMGSLRVWGRNT